MTQRRTIPIGISDFKKLRRGNHYYVDKSMFIVDIARSGSEVTLLPRPRRFGKTINLSMLRYFFDCMETDNGDLFEGLAVTRHPDVMAQQGRYPVLYLTFKDAKCEDFDEFLRKVATLLARVAATAAPAVEGLKLKSWQQQDFVDLLERRADKHAMEQSLPLLMELLNSAYGQKVILLIDEYDVPIQAGYRNQYYASIISFMRGFLGSGLKDCSFLHKGILTGILRVAKESIFSGLNNPSVRTILDSQYAQHFGFTEAEVVRVLTDNDLAEEMDTVREWYNGYRFGNAVIYNPWSILCYADSPGSGLKPYWINTSGNDLVHDLVTKERAITRAELADLIQGGSHTVRLSDAVNFQNLNTHHAVWSLLTFSGYLKPVATHTIGDRVHHELAIPNKEVLQYFEDMLDAWFAEGKLESALDEILQGLLAQDIPRFEKDLSTLILVSFSYHDVGKVPEAVFHAFFLGLLVQLRHRYQVRSNRESGLGRYDASLIPRDTTMPGFVFEFKTVLPGENLEEAADDALDQIRRRKYAVDLKDQGVDKVLALGIAIDGKALKVAWEVV